MSARGSQSGGRSSEVERIIAAAEVDTTFAGKKARYRGRRSTWPGALALFLVAAGSVFGLVYYGIKLKNDVNDQVASDAAVRNIYSSGTAISDGRPTVEVTDITITNPAKYTDNKCQQPNFVSKNGKILAVMADNTEVQIDIKGVNWLGMENSKGVPEGLWDNTREGSTMYRVSQFLSNNNFNVVRLPLAVDSVMRNIDIDISLINTNSNRAFDSVTNYLKLLSLVVQGLGQSKIGVVLDFHVLSAFRAEESTGLWYGTAIQIADIKTAIDNLATLLCNSQHFNVMGIDLKDGLGLSATWGDGSDTDWAAAATDLGNYMLTACPSWLAFVQGIQGSSHKDLYDDKEIKSRFPAGSDLSNVKAAPIKLATSNKVVYSPKYFSSSYLPYQYFFDSSVSKGDMLEDYVESSDTKLRANVITNMGYMFGDTYETGAAVVLSTFGGLMGKSADLTPKLTSTRIVNVLIEQMLATEKSLAGGFWWTLNPDTYWSYPAPDNSNGTSQGLVDDTWRAANMDVLNYLAKMDNMTHVSFIPCITS
uniref:Glycoside hydrolase family 5 domain-containing protein n=1 Tax=Globisporangium ultimum (strain ATCC 200006 / CBS 805.95 / DAOM BR144) TaxID=431595 RepID=K3WF81_GLOUD